MAWGALEPCSPAASPLSLEGNPHVLGRSDECHSKLPNDLCISNRHCSFSFDEPSSSATITDLSTNGTFLNKAKIGKGNSQPVHAGDTVTFILTDRHLSFVFRFTATAVVGQQTESEGSSVAEGLYAGDDLALEYDLREILGKGTFADVHLGVERRTGRKVAVKVVAKKRVSLVNGSNPDRLTREVDILKSISHRSIVAVQKVFNTTDHLKLVLDLAEGGDLLDLLHRRGRFPEPDAQIVFRQLCDAVRYLHARGIAHRDLKPENILLAKPDDITHVLLTDFGLAQLFVGSSLMSTMCGTPLYVAPEVLNKGCRQNVAGYTKRVDVWSLGVILYILLCGRPPFPRKKDSHGRPTKRLDYDLPLDQEPPWTAVSEEVRDLVGLMLQRNPADRIDINAAFAHPWVQAGFLQSGIHTPLSEAVAVPQDAPTKRKAANMAGATEEASLSPSWTRRRQNGP